MFEVLSFLDGSVAINSFLKEGKPCLIGKIGSAELQMMYAFFYGKHYNTKPDWGERLERDIDIVAGVFPREEQSRIDFCNFFAECLPNTDILAAWNPGMDNFEQKLIKNHNRDCVLIDLCSLEPYYSGLPWSQYLEGKKVLVVSCFAESIKAQYQKRHLLWANPKVLPNFELLTINHPTSKSISNNNPYERWADMVDDICGKIDALDYDTLLVGAGAASLIYANHAKLNGKQAIHLGGSLQILFGIKGKRWDNMEKINCFYNDSWCRPLPSETPTNYKEAENGCYW